VYTRLNVINDENDERQNKLNQKSLYYCGKHD